MSEIHPIKRTALVAAVLWTAVLLVSLCGNVLHEQAEILEFSSSQAFLADAVRALSLTHALLLLLGWAAIAYTARRFGHQAADEERAEALAMINQHLLQEAETRQQVLKAQEESAASFRAIMSTTAEGFCTLDMDGRFLSVNDALCSALGYEREALLRKQVTDLELGEDAEQWALRAAAIVAVSHRRFDARYLCADGSIKDMEASVSYLAQEGGCFYVFLRDITERKRAGQDLRTQRTSLTRLLDNTNDLVWSLDSHFRLVIANAACRHQWQSLFGHEIQAGEPALPQPESVKENCPWQTWYERALRGESFMVEASLDLGQGLIWMEFRISAILAQGDGRHWQDDTGLHEAVGIAVFGRDISQRKDDERRIRESNNRLSLSLAELQRHQQELKTIKHMSDLVQTCQTRDEAYRVVELALSQLFAACSGMLFMHSGNNGYLEAVARWGQPLGLTVFGRDDCWALRQGLLHRIEPGEEADRALVCRHLPSLPAGGYLCLPLAAQGELLGNLYLEPPQTEAPHGQPDGVQELADMVGEAITLALSSLNLRLALREQATHDPLTGLFNRRYLKETLPRELARSLRNRSPLCAVMLDIDHFKQFNDCYGHDAGDLVLKRLGALLNENLRRSDIACRYGGEELLLIMPDSALADAAQRIEQIRATVADLKLHLNGRDLGEVTFSVGIAEAPLHGDTMERLLKSADQALYAAKTSGRNQVVCCDNRCARIE